MPKKLKGAICGYGFIASQGHAPFYLNEMSLQAGDVAIVAGCDVSPERREKFQKDFTHARAYESASDLLENEKDLDFIDIATPPKFHAPIAHLALDHGIHVLCEKPLCFSAKEALGLVTHARQVRRVVYPCHNYKFAPVIQKMSSQVRQNELGKIQGVTLQTFRHTHAKGVPEWRPHWRREISLSGGGIAMDHGSHSFYLLFDWMRSYPSSLTATATRTILHGTEWDKTEDTVTCSLLFPDRRAATIYLSWASGMRKVIYALMGSCASLVVEDDRLSVIREKKDQGFDCVSEDFHSLWMDASHSHWFSPLWHNFARSIHHMDYVSQETFDAVVTMHLIESVYQSAETGVSICLPDWEEMRARLKG